MKQLFMEMEYDMMEENKELIDEVGFFKLEEMFYIKFSIPWIESIF
jgi:hypothetical protein